MKINSQIMHMRNAIETMVSMLAQRKIKVTQMGMQAYVAYHPQTGEVEYLNVPYIPDNASDELIAAVQGFIDHEVGHLLHTDQKFILEANRRGKDVAGLQNIIEDPRIEKRQAQAFKGARFNLANTGRFVLKEITEPMFRASIAQGDREKTAVGLFMPMVRALCGQEEFVDFMRDKWEHVQEIVDKLPTSLLQEIRDCRSTEHAMELAEQVKHVIQQPPEPPEPPSAGAGGGKQPPGNEPKGQGGSGGTQGEPGKEPGGEEPGGAKGQGGKEPQPGQEPAQQQPGGQDPAEPGFDGNIFASETGALDAQKLLRGMMDLKDYDSSLAEAVSARALNEGKAADYLVFTADEDSIGPIVPDSKSVNQIAEMEDVVDQMIGPMAKELERLIIARSAAQWTGGHRSGRLHGASLARLRVGRDDVFRRKHETTTKKVAFELLCDDSGSMHSRSVPKIMTAAYSAYALSSMLDRLQIPNEVTAFTTQELSSRTRARLDQDPLRDRYSRKEAIKFMVLKDFGERMTTTAKARFVHLVRDRDVADHNIDGESLMIANRRLMLRPEPRKILLVLSDGRPAGRGARNLDAHLKAVIKTITAQRTEVFGIGICDESVKNFYPRHAVVSNIHELPKAIMGELRRFLLESK